MSFTAWKHTERNKQRDRKKTICYDFMRFGDSSTVPNFLKRLKKFIRAYLDII